MKLIEFQETLNKLFDEQLWQEHEDDFGFLNRSNTSIHKVGYCTNLTLATIEQAIAHKVDLMITHHDAWDFIYGLKDECVALLTKHNISHFFIHGPLDYVEFGTCTSLMNALEVDTILRYSTFQGDSIPGVGEFENAISFEQFVQKMRSTLNEPVRVWKNNQQEIKKVGVLTGAGNSTNHIKSAIDSGCDTYITGEVSLYTIQYAQFVGINLLVGSHTFTEIFGVETLVKKIHEVHPTFEKIQLFEPHDELNHSMNEEVL
ncbi:MAG: Nif3-like dinuclear metal center hexameric protein [Paenisporosarcina sp.]